MVYSDIKDTIDNKPRLETYQKKAAATLNRNVMSFIQKHGRDNVGFLTLTFPKEVKTPKEASKRFNSLRTNFLTDVFPDTVAVIEPHKDGRPHLHLVVNAEVDIRGQFDFDTFIKAQDERKAKGETKKYRALTKKYARSAPEALRLLWKLLYTNLGKYGFGRSELLPIRSTDEALGNYVGKYLNKAAVIRKETGWHGVRLTRYTHGSNQHNANFAWVSNGSTLWRSKLATLGKWLGISPNGPVHEIDQLTEVLGDRWAHKLRPIIDSIVPEVWVHKYAHTCTWQFDTGQMFRLGDETFALAYNVDPETGGTTFGLLAAAAPPSGTDDYNAAEIIDYTPPPDINLPARHAIVNWIKHIEPSLPRLKRERIRQMMFTVYWGLEAN